MSIQQILEKGHAVEVSGLRLLIDQLEASLVVYRDSEQQLRTVADERGKRIRDLENSIREIQGQLKREDNAMMRVSLAVVCHRALNPEDKP